VRSPVPVQNFIFCSIWAGSEFKISAFFGPGLEKRVPAAPYWRAVILFRDVEHCEISSVNGTRSIQFPEFCPNDISLIPRNSSQFRNSVEFLQLQMIPDPTNSQNSGIQSQRNRTQFRNWNRFPSDSHLTQFSEFRTGIACT
jgi:hypothetical protein